MDFVFMDCEDRMLFIRSDAESAHYVHEEMSLDATFPYDPAKVIKPGMRVRYKDGEGEWIVFEIRRAKVYEPDMYQEVSGELIAQAELTDEHFEGGVTLEDMTAGDAMVLVLRNTGWELGENRSREVSGGDISMGSVWQAIGTIKTNWNLRVTPRVEIDAAGRISGRYIDIRAAGAEDFRGARLSLERGADEVGVTWNDTNLKTALYAYGRSVEDETTGESAPLTLKDAVWEETDEHPAKPAGRMYLEDPEGTAEFGRNGRPRFGFYQNSDIDDPQVLLEKTWETLKTVRTPDVTIDAMVADLKRLGMTHEKPLRLGETVIIDLTGTKIHLERAVQSIDEDLLDPTATQVCIGGYMPNIVYIQRDIAEKATGGGGGSGGQTAAEYKLLEFETQILKNNYEISQRAFQRDLEDETGERKKLESQLNVQADSITSIVAKCGIDEIQEGESLYSKIEQNSGQISLMVADGGIISLINAKPGEVKIRADAINLEGVVTTDNLSAKIAEMGSLYLTNLVLNGFIRVPGNGLFVGSGGASAQWCSTTVMTPTGQKTINYLGSDY